MPVGAPGPSSEAGVWSGLAELSDIAAGSSAPASFPAAMVSRTIAATSRDILRRWPGSGPRHLLSSLISNRLRTGRPSHDETNVMKLLVVRVAGGGVYPPAAAWHKPRVVSSRSTP